MFRLLLPVAIVCAQTALAESGGSNVFACVGNDGLWFSGHADGTEGGAFSGVLSDGTACGGDWTAKNAIGIGQANIGCDDGRSGVVFYTFRDSETGTALGRGMTEAGEVISIWAGNGVRQYLGSSLPCPDGAIPIG